MKPKSILDPTFVYVPSVKTDIRETFARVRAEMAAAQEEPTPQPPAPEAREAEVNP